MNRSSSSAPGRAPWRNYLLAALAAVRGVDAGAIARGLADKARIPEAVHEARVAALKALG